MRDANEETGIVRHEHATGDHRLAVGVVAGAALGVGVGLLLAPRKGSELREQIKVQATRAANGASNGYHAAADKAGAWAHRCRDAYDSTRHHVVDTYHETTRYIGEVSDAVTMKARRQAEGPAKRITVTQPQPPVDQPESIRRRTGGSLESRIDPTERSKAVVG